VRQLKTENKTFSLRPGFVFAYMTGTVEELEKPLFLMSVRTSV